ncbi:MAG TPA: mobile mystery protein B [Rhodanobacteraceae bacterium]|nr:mobile mystery protein B [Rhodanobacteraceae bacterium]
MSAAPPGAMLEAGDGQTPLDPDDAQGLRLDIGTRRELNDAEELNIQAGVRWGQRRARRENPLDLVFARELHRRMFGDVWRWAGTFRTRGTNIGVDAAHIATAMQQLIDDANYWIESSVYPDEELFARFHHRLVQIHCFPNGNGRHARALTDLAIAKHGRPAFGWGASFGAAARAEYLASLREADAGDFARLIAFVRH